MKKEQQKNLQLNNHPPPKTQPTNHPRNPNKNPHHYSKILSYLTVFFCETGLTSDVHNMQVDSVVLLASVWQGLCPHPHWSCAVCDWRLFYVEILSVSPAEVGLFSQDSKGTLRIQIEWVEKECRTFHEL